MFVSNPVQFVCKQIKLPQLPNTGGTLTQSTHSYISFLKLCQSTSFLQKICLKNYRVRPIECDAYNDFDKKFHANVHRFFDPFFRKSWKKLATFENGFSIFSYKYELVRPFEMVFLKFSMLFSEFLAHLLNVNFSTHELLKIKKKNGTIKVCKY